MRPFAPVSNYFVEAIAFVNQILIPALLTLAFFMFLWGVYNYFIAGGTNEEKRGEGAKFVMWAVIGLAVIFSVWGLVGLLLRTLHLGGEVRPPLPQFAPPGQADMQGNRYR